MYVLIDLFLYTWLITINALNILKMANISVTELIGSIIKM